MQIVSTPPPPTPPVNPTAPVQPSGPILAAVQTGSSPSPVATGASPSFTSLGTSTQFPLFQTTIDGSFGGDPASTQAGAGLTISPNGSASLTVNNPAVNINNVPVLGYPGTQVGTYQIATTLNSDNLDYTRYGYWLRYQPTEGLWQASAFTGGFLTPSSDIPTSGTATFTGTATGIYNDAAACNCANQFVSRMTGDVSLIADFGQSTLAGSIKNITLSSVGSQVPGPMNDLGFSATIDRQANLFSGPMSPTTTPGGAWAFSNAATGRIDGRFYGPAAREVGAIFQLTEGLKRLVGSIGGKGP